MIGIGEEVELLLRRIQLSCIIQFCREMDLFPASKGASARGQSCDENKLLDERKKGTSGSAAMRCEARQLEVDSGVKGMERVGERVVVGRVRCKR